MERAENFSFVDSSPPLPLRFSRPPGLPAAVRGFIRPVSSRRAHHRTPCSLPVAVAADSPSFAVNPRPTAAVQLFSDRCPIGERFLQIRQASRRRKNQLRRSSAVRRRRRRHCCRRKIQTESERDPLRPYDSIAAYRFRFDFENENVPCFIY